MASLVALSLLLSTSAAATQYYFVDRVTESFDTGPGGFTPSSGGCTPAYAIHHEGLGSELCAAALDGETAYLSETFASYVPTLGVRFWVDVISHTNPAKNMSLARVWFLNPTPSTELRIMTNGTGYLKVYFGNVEATSTTYHMVTGSGADNWYEINVYYTTNDDVAHVYVTQNGGSQILLASESFARAFRSGVAVDLGIFEPGSSGQVAIDYFRLYASPMLNISKPVVNATETITISGVQFKPSSYANLTISSATGQRVVSYSSIAVQSDGKFSRSIDLRDFNLSAGLYDVSASQPAPYGQVVFHLGIWGLSSSTISRTVPFNVTGYGAKPNSQVTVNIVSISGLYPVSTPNPIASSAGSFVSQNVVLPASQPREKYRVTLAALGTIDYASYSFSDALTFDLGPAPLAVLVQTNARNYMRTQIVSITAVAKYYDKTTVPSTSQFLLSIQAGTKVVVVNALMIYNAASGLWTYSFTLPSNSPTGFNGISVIVTDPSSNVGSGAANFTVTAAAIHPQFDFGQSVQRSETINITAMLTYPDLTPVYQGTFNLVVKFGTTSHVASMRYSAVDDRWKASVTILPSDPLGVWSLDLIGADTMGNTLNVTLPFTVSTATMSIVNEVDLDLSYQRTTSIFFQVVVRYPSTQRMTTGDVNATITFLGGANSYVSSLTFNAAAQAWKGYLRVPADAPEGVYSAVVLAVDPSGNGGNLSAVISVVKATLAVNVAADKREFQVGFDTVKFNGSVLYPDGSVMKNGSVTVEVGVGANRKVIDMQQLIEGVWTASMPTGFFDSGGEYSIIVRASDEFDNTGTATFPLTASQLYVILSLVGVALALAIALALIWRFRQSRTGGLPTVGVEYEHYL